MAPSSAILEQYAALTAGAGIAELAGRTIISVTGNERVQFLQSFTTNDVKKLAVGGGCEAFVTGTQGKTLGHVLIFCEANQHILDTTPGQADALIAHFNRYIITEEVEFVDRTSALRDLLLAGNNSATLLATVTGIGPPTELLGHASAIIADCNVFVRRVEYAGPHSFLIQVAPDDVAAIRAAFISIGAVACDAGPVESARLEGGYPLFGLDITEENLPQEAARDKQAISFTKGCYLGQETVARIDALGHVNRLLVRLKLDSDRLPANGDSVLAGAQPVGQVTSAAWSPRFNAPLAFAYVRRNYAKPGTKLSSSGSQAEVIAPPSLESA